jgi:hypothetical protein
VSDNTGCIMDFLLFLFSNLLNESILFIDTSINTMLLYYIYNKYYTYYTK